MTKPGSKRKTFLETLPWKWIGLGLGIAALIGAWHLLPLSEWLESFEHRIENMGALGGVLYGLVYLAGSLFFVPGSILTLGAGYVFGLFWGTVIVSIASTAAAAVAFLIARYLARKKVETAARRNKKFGAMDRAIGKKGWKVIALLRLSPLVPFGPSNYFYGLTSVRFLPYILASWAAMLPGTFFYVYLGSIGKNVGHGKTTGEWVLLGAGLLSTIAVTVILTRVAKKELSKSHAGGQKP
jgi:uncharacterized membrane protein YdjX (TVP38/TMEM64 family)